MDLVTYGYHANVSYLATAKAQIATNGGDFHSYKYVPHNKRNMCG